jgi:formate dehydrogenase accessory protein FdhD
MTEKVKASLYKNGNYIEKEEEIVSDEIITLVINDSLTRNFSISPDSLEDFTVGYMLGEGIICTLSQHTQTSATVSNRQPLILLSVTKHSLTAGLIL